MGSQEFKCKDCQINYNSLSKLKYHRIREHGKWKQGFLCDKCQTKFSSSSNLKRHSLKCHSQDDNQQKKQAKSCPHCDYSSSDNFHLKIHLRKHSGQRPFNCDKCQFGFYKKSDLVKHSKNCRGIRYQCSKCSKVFHFKKQLHEHKLWSSECGEMRDQIHLLNEQSKKNNPHDRYMNSKSSLVKININQVQSVVGVNFDDLINTDSFEKRVRKGSCGICQSCELNEDCGLCSVCQLSTKTKKICLKRRCINLIDQYDLKKDKLEFVLQETLDDQTKQDQIVENSQTMITQQQNVIVENNPQCYNTDNYLLFNYHDNLSD